MTTSSNICLIFDNDGTLVDSELVQHSAMADELALLGIDIQPEILSEQFRGWKLDKQLKTIETESGITIDGGLIGRFRIRLANYLEAQLKPIPNVTAALATLPQTKCIASNAPVDKVELCLRVTGLSEHFGGQIYSAYDIERWKPEPDLFVHAANDLGYDPSACVVIEDSAVGIAAAEAAGMRAVLYNPLSLPMHTSKTTIEIRDMALLPATISSLS